MPKSKNLVIVESPAKARTISKFLGKDYKVMASMGHIRDLPKSKIGIDVRKNFEPTYDVPENKAKVIKDLVDKIGAKTQVWIATDEDREGEAIGWHLVHALGLDEKKVKRIVFHEITKGAILEAIDTPRKLDHNLIDAQQARRVLDRLVGYKLSPVLWKKIRYGLSAGRVQSVAVRLIVEREREILAFNAEEYWNVIAHLENKKKNKFEAHLLKYDKKKFESDNEKKTKKIVTDLKKQDYIITKIEKKETKKNPPPPFITSTLQQDAARKLGFSVKKTMVLAQQLYEGIKHGEKGHAGIITYMRTDSVNLAKSALSQIKKFIKKEYGAEYGMDVPRVFKSKKGAQEAHEAIRPVDITNTPDEMKKYLEADQLKLYKLIWKRTMATQMACAIMNKVIVDIEAGKGLFRANGQTVKFPGFLKVYKESTDHNNDDDAENLLPELEEGEKLKLDKLDPTQHFTKPPPRYTEASLVKKLEEEGIGRPSTYAPTISTVITRGYIDRDLKQLKPTDVGFVVNDLLVKHFTDIVDYKFTAGMEDDLDDIADGKKKWVPIIKAFYTPFEKLVKEKTESIKKEDLIKEKTDEKCDECGGGMVVKLGRFGKFLSCANYPECKFAKPMEDNKTDEEKKMEKKLAGKKCDKCGEPMEIKIGRFGQFLGCSGYPKCKNMESIVKPSGVKCPECKDGQLIERRTRKRGQIFYGCNKYPDCKFASWDKPLPDKCNKCGGLVVEKKGKPTCHVCKLEQGEVKKKD
ncbi:type I DNA topoisomerase [Patescibacteria group bacterium]|nr:type I DNA topoisomerase [Patescibacteria group bacterium]